MSNLRNDLGGLRKVRISLKSRMKCAKVVELAEVSSRFTFGQTTQSTLLLGKGPDLAQNTVPDDR